VYISHTSELRAFPEGTSYVAAVERAVSACGHVIVDMADFPVADRVPAELCAERVRGCDVYVGVLGIRYGSLVRDKPEVSYTRALRNLHRLSLVTQDLADPVSSVRMHALAQRSATDSLDRDQLAAAVRAAAAAVVEVWPEVESGTGLGSVLRANAATLARRAPDALWQPAAHPVIFRAGRSLDAAGLVADAVAHFRSAVDLAMQHLGPDDRDTLRGCRRPQGSGGGLLSRARAGSSRHHARPGRSS
jgi:Domain of unknown function (DUF4062)